MDTLKNIMTANGHEKKTLFYLKVFIESLSSNEISIAISNTKHALNIYVYKQIGCLWKVDIEGAELNGMPEWIESGALERVKLKHLGSSNSTDDDDG